MPISREILQSSYKIELSINMTEKPNPYIPPLPAESQNDSSHLRPSGLQEGSLNRPSPLSRLKPTPKATKAIKEVEELHGLHAAKTVEGVNKARIKEVLQSKIHELDAIVAEYEEPLLPPEKVQEVVGFIHSLGLDTKPIYLLRGQDYTIVRTKDVGHYDFTHDAVVLNVDALSDHTDSTDSVVINLSLIAHELAHSSSQNSMYYEGLGRVFELTGRIGMRVDKEKCGHVGEALEEGFADYIRLLYLKTINYDLSVLYGEKYLHPTRFRGVDFMPEGTKNLNIGTNDNAETAQQREVCIRTILSRIDLNDEDNLTIYMSNRLVFTLEDQEYGKIRSFSGGYPLLAESFELLMLDDPSLLQSFIRGRKDVQGLREVAQKLNALEPGLYIKLQNLDISTDGQFEFYKAVVAVLNKKYFPNGQPIEIREEGEQTQNPH